MRTVKDSQGHEYKGAEVTSEGFHVFGLDPYQYYSAGIACYLSNTQVQQDAWDVWDNHAPIAGVKNGNIIGYKYFGFEGLKKDQLGLKAFEGTKKGNQTAFNLFIIPRTTKAFKVNVWMDGPWDNEVWKGKKIGEINVPAGSKQEMTRFTIDVASAVEGLKGKHAIYLVAEGEGQEPLFDMEGLGFSSKKKDISRPVIPTVTITVDGKAVETPKTPVRSTNANGITDYTVYEVSCPQAGTNVPVVAASASDKDVKIAVTQAESATGTAVVKCTWGGQTKTYRVVFGQAK